MINKKVQTKETLLKMLEYVLVELRSSDNIEVIRALADIFHNLSGTLISNWSEETSLRAYNEIFNKSRKWKLEEYILNLQKLADANQES